MTIRDFPRTLHSQMVDHWVGDGNAHEAYVDWVVTTEYPIPDRAGLTNPDEFTTRWEWDTDLTPGEAAEFDAFIDVLGGLGDAPGFAAAAAAIDTLKAFRNRGGTATDAQRDAAIDALIDLERFSRR